MRRDAPLLRDSQVALEEEHEPALQCGRGHKVAPPPHAHPLTFPRIQGVTCAGCAAGRSEMWRMRGVSWHRYLHSPPSQECAQAVPQRGYFRDRPARADTAERLAACPRQALTMMRVPPILTTGIVMADRGAWKVPGLNDPTGCALDPSSLGHWSSLSASDRPRCRGAGQH